MQPSRTLQPPFAPAGPPAGTAALKSAVQTGENAARRRRSAPVQTRRHAALLGAGATADAGERGARKMEPARAADNASVTVAARPGQVLSSARHAGENSSMESPKAQPPGTAQAKGPRAQQKSGERYGRRAPAYPPKGHTVIRLSTYIYRGCRAATENLSGKRTDGACAARSRIRPFFVHPDGAPTR